MTALVSYPHLVLFLSLLVSLSAWAGVSKGFRVVARIVLVALCAENGAAIIDLMVGAAIAALPVGAKLQHCRAALSLRASGGASEGFQTR